MPGIKIKGNISPNLVIISGLLVGGYFAIRKGLFGEGAKQFVNDASDTLIKTITNDIPATIGLAQNTVSDKILWAQLQNTVLKWEPIIKKVQSRIGEAALTNLTEAIIFHESNGNPNARGRANDIGLMQVTPIALNDINKEFGTAFLPFELTDPEKNIEAGIRFIQLTERRLYGQGIEANIKEIAKAYNCGVVGSIKNPNCDADFLGVNYSDRVANSVRVLLQGKAGLI